MNHKFTAAFTSLGGISFFSGIIVLSSLFALRALPGLRGPNVPLFLAYFGLAAVGYGIAVLRIGRDRIPLRWVWVLAILFRVTLLFTEPSLSDDVYRYAWDGHLFNQGINPYAYPVEAAQLDEFDIPLRASVNHAWMASPYLPTSQILFAGISLIAPQSIKIFQIAAVVFDLLTGWLVLGLLRAINKPRSSLLIYLWNPLVVVEFAHGAHIDALMIFLMTLSLWFMVKSTAENQNRFLLASVVSLAFATLTKPLPALLAPLFIRRWGWGRLLLFIGLVLFGLSLFVPGAGWGLSGPLNGTGVFGASRIYSQFWNFNSGLYHWLEVVISGYPTPGAVPADVIGERPILIAKMFTVAFFGLLMAYSIWRSQKRNLTDEELIQLSIIPLGSYLLLSPTVHPWYLALIIPLLPFLKPGQRWPWIYLSLAIVLSYVTYLNPADFREYVWVRWTEYLPFFALLMGLPILDNLTRKKSHP